MGAARACVALTTHSERDNPPRECHWCMPLTTPLLLDSDSPPRGSLGHTYPRKKERQVSRIIGSMASDGIAASVMVCLVLSAAALLLSIKVVPPANVGVVVTLGSVSEDTLPSGVHLVNPLASAITFSLKTQLLEQANFVPTKEGLTVELDTALLFHVDPKQVRELYLKLGENYMKTVVEPELASAVRGLTSEAEASALYTSGRAEMQAKLQKELTEALTPRGLLVETVLLKAVKLPDLLKHSIEQKVSAEQDSERMAFVIAKEKQEAERKAIEAKGIADYQLIVSDGVTPELLQWKGIEATREIAVSTNAKVVLVGNSKDSMPVILGGEQGMNGNKA